MADPIQSSSSIPVPVYQTFQAKLDPQPVDSSDQVNKSNDTHADQTDNKQSDDFKRYLDDHSIQNLVANKKSLEFDPAEEIRNKSIYQPPAQSTPI